MECSTSTVRSLEFSSYLILGASLFEVTVVFGEIPSVSVVKAFAGALSAANPRTDSSFPASGSAPRECRFERPAGGWSSK